MPLDPQIPLAATQQPSFAQQMGQTFELAGAIEKQKQFQEQRQDQQYIQEALKAGANFNTPQGILTTAEGLKGKVSPKAYQTMISAADDMKTNEYKKIEAMAKAPEQMIKTLSDQNNLVGQTLQQLMSTYDEDVKQYGTQQADVLLKQRQQETVQRLSAQKTPDGQPILPPQFFQELPTLNRGQMNARFEGTVYGQEQLDRVQKRRTQEAQRIESLASAEAKRAGREDGESLVGVVTGGGNPGVNKQSAALKATQQAHPWLTPEEVGKKYLRAKGLRSSITQQRNAMGKLEGFERTALANIDLLANEMKDIRGKQRVDLPLANRFLSFIKQQAGIPYDQAAGMYGREIAAELTKLASSATASGTGGTLTDREEWNKFFEKGASFDQMMKSIDAARKSASARIKASHEAIQLNEDEIENLWVKPGEKTLPEEVPQGQLKKPGASAILKGMPEGSTMIGHPPGDPSKNIWKDPKTGKMYLE